MGASRRHWRSAAAPASRSTSSHHRTSAINAGRVAERLELIDAAKAEGVDITLELYPYPAGSTFLVSFLPSYAHEGGPDSIRRRLNDVTERSRIVKELDENPRRAIEDMVMSYMPADPTLEGMTLQDIAGERGVSLGEAICACSSSKTSESASWDPRPRASASGVSSTGTS